MYEVEYKVEITEEEKSKLEILFKESGYEIKSPVVQNDYYIEAKESPVGGYDLKRYRDEGNRIFYTEKIWEEVEGGKIRKEVEHLVEMEVFQTELPKYPNTLKIQKTRQTFSGKYNDNDIHIDMDSIKFDHSPSVRYFIEAEVLSSDKNSVMDLKKSLIEFIKNSLGKSELVESPGMFNMAFNKL